MQDISRFHCLFSRECVSCSIRHLQYTVNINVFRMNMNDSDRIATAIANYARGDSTALSEIGFGDEYIHLLRDFMNKYAVTVSPAVVEILAGCLLSYNPVMALGRFSEFMERTGGNFAEKLVSKDTAHVLSSVFSISNALSRRLNGDPDLVTLLDNFDTPLAAHTDTAYYRQSIQASVDTVPYPGERRHAIHRMHTVHLMRICARNCNPREDIAIVNRELSLLADAVIDTCLAIAADEVSLRLEIEQKPHRLVVLGLGKLGGGELNVSSDIDLIYLCDETGDTWGRYDSRWFHTMLAEQLTRILTEMTDLGILYRVDTRLRADGASGPLVRTTVEYFRYLEMRGEAWERQMLVKARPVAGDIPLGEEFLNSLERFIFPASISRSPHREIVAIKTRIEARLEKDGKSETNLKLMPGGVRDIEFITQCLQLLMGGTHPDVRCASTLDGIFQLHGSGAFSDEEFTRLTQAYRLYRRIENARQWRELLAGFSIPESGEDATTLAAFLGYAPNGNDPGESLIRDIHTYLQQVRHIYDDVFSTDATESFEESALYTAMHPTGNDRSRRFLESLGFTDPEGSAKTLSRLAFGEEIGIHEAMIPQSVQLFIPKLLHELSDVPDPAGSLDRFQHMVAAYRARTTLFSILVDNTAFFNLLLSISQASVFITDILITDPSLLDWLVESGGINRHLDHTDVTSELRRIDLEIFDDQQYSSACRALEMREKLRIGARDISGLATTAETFNELSEVAELIVQAVYKRVALNYGHPGDFTFSVMAAGRLGAGTMNFGSDLDLIFVYDIPESAHDDVDVPARTAAFAQRVLHLLTGGGGAAKIYDVDARLRPEGGSATLTVSLDEYRRYLEQRASIWERLALVRARTIAGDAMLGKGITELLERFVFAGPLTASDLERILSIRAMMTEKALSRGADTINVKSGPGGIADIDFIAQTYSVHFGADHPAVRKRGSAEILDALAAENLIDRQTSSTLIEQYNFLNELDKTLRIGSGRSMDIVQVDDREILRVAGLLGFKNVRRFRKRLGDAISLTRELYERTMTSLPVSE